MDHRFKPTELKQIFNFISKGKEFILKQDWLSLFNFSKKYVFARYS